MQTGNYFRISALLFSFSTGAFVTIAVWTNVSRHDRALLLAVFEMLMLASGYAGPLFALLAYRTPRKPKFDAREYRMGWILYAVTVVLGGGAIIAIKVFFPDLPE